MNFKNSFYFSIFLLSLSTFSQNKNSEATYRFYIQQEENNKMSSQMKEEQNAVEKAAKKATLKLVFNDTKAIYFVDHGLMNPKNDINYSVALIYCGGKTPIYTDRNRGISCYNSSEIFMYKDNEFLVTDSIPTTWKLHNETKVINNYTCYKATLEKEYEYYSDKVIHPVTAWYCPEFPYSFGPKGFGGLPGLIFEIQDYKTVIGLESIVLNNNDKEIILPTKGKVIKEVDFKLKLNNSVQEYMDSLKSKD